eukprot:3934805-Rhodomonas_salina.1
MPMTLHFTPHATHVNPLYILLGILTTAYSMLSANTTKQCNASYSFGSAFNLANISTDTTMLVMDTLFWIFYFVAHLTLYLTLIRICTVQAIVSYAVITLFVSWGVCHRVLQSNPPALVISAVFLLAIHLQVVSDVVQRNMDMWLPYILLVAIDAVMVLCHTIDEVLTPEVAYNCRISFVTAMDVLILAVVIYLSN